MDYYSLYLRSGSRKTRKKGFILNFLQNARQSIKKEISFKNDTKERKREAY
jgi:hypothetical protein